MKRYLILFAVGLVLGGWLTAHAWAQDNEPEARFRGGSYDGYDSCDVENTTISSGLPAGTVFIMM